MKFSCERTNDSLRLKVGSHEGSFPAWWKEIHVEIYGWTPKQDEVLVDAKKDPVHLERGHQGIGLTLADSGKGTEIELK
jgi:alpha-glucosidase